MQKQIIKIIESWIDIAKEKTPYNPELIKNLWILLDFTYNDLTYVKSNDIIQKVITLLDNFDNTNKDVIAVRNYLKV